MVSGRYLDFTKWCNKSSKNTAPVEAVLDNAFGIPPTRKNI